MAAVWTDERASTGYWRVVDDDGTVRFVKDSDLDTRKAP